MEPNDKNNKINKNDSNINSNPLDDPRLTAYALGELEDPTDIQHIESLLENNPEAQQLVADIKATADLVGNEFAAEACPELTTQQRQTIESSIAELETSDSGIITRSNYSFMRSRRFWVGASITGLAACTVLAVYIPQLLSQNRNAEHYAVGTDLTVKMPTDEEQAELMKKIDPNTIWDRVEAQRINKAGKEIVKDAATESVNGRGINTTSVTGEIKVETAVTPGLAANSPDNRELDSLTTDMFFNDENKAPAEVDDRLNDNLHRVRLKFSGTVSSDLGTIGQQDQKGTAVDSGTPVLSKIPVVDETFRRSDSYSISGGGQLEPTADRGRSSVQSGTPAYLVDDEATDDDPFSEEQYSGFSEGGAFEGGFGINKTNSKQKKPATTPEEENFNTAIRSQLQIGEMWNHSLGQNVSDYYKYDLYNKLLWTLQQNTYGLSENLITDYGIDDLNEPAVLVDTGIAVTDDKSSITVDQQKQLAEVSVINLRYYIQNRKYQQAEIAVGTLLTLEKDNATAKALYNTIHELNSLSFGTESYSRITDNHFNNVTDQPLSTFSVDVDTASYTNLRRFLISNHTLPPASAIRIEEMINYFDYNYASPARDAPHPFATYVEVAPCPWNTNHKLAKIGLKGKEIPRDERPATSLVFLLDVSGSMSDSNKLPLVKQSMKTMVENLLVDDRVAIVTYAGASQIVLASTSCAERQKILDAISNLSSGGSTNGGAGIQQAYEIATNNFIEGGVNRVILATDGDFNVGVTNNNDLVQLIEDKAKTGVFLSVLGFGMGNIQDDKLEQLADKGNGNYAYIDNYDEAYHVLVEKMAGTLVTIAKDVKIQVDFNPSKVAAYRLIGYENRMLAARDFKDDTKDAGEIGAGHTVTAMYEIIPVNNGEIVADNVDNSVYQQTIPTPRAEESNELFNLKLRYKQPDENVSTEMVIPVNDNDNTLDQASIDFRFAASVASYGMLLRCSPYSGASSFDMVLELAGYDPGKIQNIELCRKYIRDIVNYSRNMPNQDLLLANIKALATSEIEDIDLAEIVETNKNPDLITEVLDNALNNDSSTDLNNIAGIITARLENGRSQLQEMMQYHNHNHDQAQVAVNNSDAQRMEYINLVKTTKLILDEVSDFITAARKAEDNNNENSQNGTAH